MWTQARALRLSGVGSLVNTGQTFDWQTGEQPPGSGTVNPAGNAREGFFSWLVRSQNSANGGWQQNSCYGDAMETALDLLVLIPTVFGPPTVPCPTCELDQAGAPVTVVADKNVTVNFNPSTPTCNDGYNDGAHLCKYFTADKSGGATPDKWKAVFDVGGKKLVVLATITTTPVPAYSNNRKAPGIEIISTCELLVDRVVDQNGKLLALGAIVVNSLNQQAGNIAIKVDGPVTINGTILDAVDGTLGRPGAITVDSCCGDIVTGPQSLIQTAGVDPGGNNINLLTCKSVDGKCGKGNIVINGLVRAIYKTGIAPTINIVSFDGAVTIDGNNDFGEQVIEGTAFRVTSGVVVFSTHDPHPGKINIQAQGDITVKGNHILNRYRTQFGAVAVKTGSNSSAGGAIDVRSIGGKIIGMDRAFDDANRYNTAAKIGLLAKGDITLSVTAAKDDGAANNTKPVVSTQGGNNGKGGTNTLRSFSGGINIGANAQVLADFAPAPGANGTNLLTSCTGVNNLGTVKPADLIPGDDSGVCTPAAPDPIWTDCSNFFNPI